MACMNKNDKSSKIEQKEKAPKTLTEVSDGIDELLDSLDSIMEIVDLTESEFQTQQSNKGEKMEDESNNKSGNNSEEGKNQREGQENKGNHQSKKEKGTMTKDEALFLKWMEVDKKLEEIHESWNNYEVESIKKGVNTEKANEFKKNLNAFSIAVENRTMEDIVNIGSKTINFLAVYFDLYKDEIRGDLSRIKYSVYQSFIEGQRGNKDLAKELLTNAEDHISRIRQKIEKEEDKIKDLDKLSLSITDMRLALEDNNEKLLKIKRDIALNNIKSLEE